MKELSDNLKFEHGKKLFHISFLLQERDILVRRREAQLLQKAASTDLARCMRLAQVINVIFWTYYCCYSAVCN